MIFPVPGPGALAPLTGPLRTTPKLPPQTAPQKAHAAPPGDRVELSEVAVIVARLKGTAPERMARILSIKREIDLGSYVTQEKLDQALYNLVDTLSHRNLRR